MACKGSNAKDENASPNILDEGRAYHPKTNTPGLATIDFEVRNSSHPLIPDAQIIASTMRQLQAQNYFQILGLDSLRKIENNKFPNLIGDINKDQILDVLMPYTAFGNTKVDSFFLYYLVLLNDGNELIPMENFFCGAREAELYIRFDKITDSGTVVGKQIPGIINKYPDEFPLQYYFDGQQLMAVPR